MPELWIWCLLVFQSFSFSYCSSEVLYVARSACLHTYGTTISVTAVGSLLRCTNICKTEPQCTSAVYNPGTKECITNTDASSQIGDTSTCSPVVKYVGVLKRRCTVDSDCTTPANSECREEFCQCTDGYSFSPSEGTCTRLCSTYGDTFRTIPGAGMAANNDKTVYGRTLTECEVICIQTTNFVCRAVEYETSTQTCHMTRETSYTKPGAYGTGFPGWVWLHRNCA